MDAFPRPTGSAFPRRAARWFTAGPGARGQTGQQCWEHWEPCAPTAGCGLDSGEGPGAVSVGQDPGWATPRALLTGDRDTMGHLPHGRSTSTTCLGNFVNRDPRFTS